MKIIFEDKSYISVEKSSKDDHIVIIIQAKDAENPQKKITNAVEITLDQFKSLTSLM